MIPSSITIPTDGAPHTNTDPCPCCCTEHDVDCTAHFKILKASVCTLTVTANNVPGCCGTGFSGTFALPYTGAVDATPCTTGGAGWQWSATIGGHFIEVSNVKCDAGNVITIGNVAVDSINDGNTGAPCNLTGGGVDVLTVVAGVGTGSGALSNGLVCAVTGTYSVSITGMYCCT